ncbi:CHAT domain-containing protein [Oculatella sp. LEGE 06141]|uniref:CHAT domain-containing protein n=1 Tax=Oculatella sp. LEGE 06141 TaxID=1828648 RepID=UPI0018825C18|nr:CHAT domain-containing protein [Oculatella sp. LEGE 06141]MBE9178964.1 CHAT domain-containing protein [Oculatella sp. LEGE 06141]
MKFIRLILLFLLACSWAIVGSFLPLLLHNQPVQATPASSMTTSMYPQPLSALRLDVERLQQTLDREDLADAIRQVELGWKQQYEDYYQGNLTSQVLGSDQIAQSLNQIARLTGRRSALIYAIPTPEQLELILLPPRGQPVHQRISEANRERLNQTVETFRAGVVNVSSQASEYLPVAQQLYQWIIAPLEADLEAQRIDTLIFCLGTGLRSLPLAALHDGERFLIEKYSFGIIPAFNLLDRQPAALANTRVLAMGASEFQQEAPLPAVPVELAAITQLWQGETWLNQEFTMETLKARRSSYPFGIIHLATHAAFVGGSVDESYIQFWDQPLHLDRLRELNLRLPIVQLLVLSACRTALGDPNAELGFAGLAVQSGAKAALASLWSVSDAGTLVLMIDFYRQLMTAPIKADALRQAQLAMLRGQLQLQSSPILRAIGRNDLPVELRESASVDLSHPYYWAAFTLIGNPW